jgi:hypothetical protein
VNPFIPESPPARGQLEYVPSGSLRWSLDEVGFRPGRREIRHMAVERLVSAHDEKGSIFSRPISTLRDSTEILASDDILTAIPDRLLHQRAFRPLRHAQLSAAPTQPTVQPQPNQLLT